ncbi:MAG: tetratricopeptide repeat protein [Proteobacteria bacterium]|nr:tetratricopeptide repeat protein [Pseudomonadota bacterium]
MSTEASGLSDVKASAASAAAAGALRFFSAEEVQLDESRGAALGALLGAANQAAAGAEGPSPGADAATVVFADDRDTSWPSDPPPVAPAAETVASASASPSSAPPHWSMAELVDLGPLTMISTGEVLPEATPAPLHGDGPLGRLEDDLDAPEPWRVPITLSASELTVAEIEQLELPLRGEPSARPSPEAWSWVLDVLHDEARHAPTAQLAADLQLAAAQAARQLGESELVVELLREALVQHPRDVGALLGLWCEHLRQHDLRAAAEVLGELAPTTRVRERGDVGALRADLLFAAGAPLAEVATALPDYAEGWDQRLIALDLAAAGGGARELIDALTALLLGAQPGSDVRASLTLIVGRLHEAAGDLAAAQLAYDEAARGATAAAATLGALRLAQRTPAGGLAGDLQQRAIALFGAARAGAAEEEANPPALERAWAAGAGDRVRDLSEQLARRTTAAAERAQLLADAGWAAETLELDGASAAALYGEALQSDPQHAGARRGLQRLALQHPAPPRAAAALAALAAVETGSTAAALQLQAARVLAPVAGQALAVTQHLAAAAIGDPGCPPVASWLVQQGQSPAQTERIATALETAAEAASAREDAVRLWRAAAELYDGALELPLQALRCYQRWSAIAGETPATSAAIARLSSSHPRPSASAQAAPADGERLAAWEAGVSARGAGDAWARWPRALYEASRGDWTALASHLRRASLEAEPRSWTALAQALRLAGLLERGLGELAQAAPIYARLAAAPIVAAAGLTGWWRCCSAAASPALVPPTTLRHLVAQLGETAAPGLLLLPFDPRLVAVPEACEELALHLLDRSPSTEPWRQRARGALAASAVASATDGRTGGGPEAGSGADTARQGGSERELEHLRALGQEAQRVLGEDAAAYWLVFGGRLAGDHRAGAGAAKRSLGGTAQTGGLRALPTAQSAFGRVMAVQQWPRVSADPREVAAGELLAELVRARPDREGGVSLSPGSALFLGEVHDRRQAALRAGRWLEAFEAVQAELRLARVPEHRHAAHWLAAELAACQLGRPADAVAHLSRLTDLDPEDTAAQDCLTQVLVAAGQWAELVRAVESWIARQPSADRRLGWHRLVFRVSREQLRDLPRAERHAQAALVLCPHDGGALWTLADVCEQQQRWPEAAAAIATAAELERSRGGRIALLVRLGALALQRLGDPHRAAAAYEAAVQLDPAHREALRGLAQCARWRGQIDRALELTAHLVESEVDLRQRLLDLLKMARHCELDLGDPRRAGALLRRAVELAPADLQALADLVSFGARWPHEADPSLYLDRALTAMRARLAIEAEESFALHAIFRICEWRGLADGRWCAAQTLSALGQADSGEQAFLAQHPADHATPPSRALFDDEAQALLLPTGLPRAVLRVFAALRQPIARLSAGRVAEHGLSPRDRISDVRHPWRVAADGLAREWGVETFEIYAVGHRPQLMTLEPCDPPAVLVGADWLHQATEPERTFMLARALWRLRQALAPVSKLSSAELQRLLLAITHLHGVDGSMIGLVDREVEQVSARLGRWVSRRLRDTLRPYVLECVGGGFDPLLLPMAAEVASNRAGLLACRSVPAALSVLRRVEDRATVATATTAERERRGLVTAELLRFAVSDAHLLLRRRLGLDPASR